MKNSILCDGSVACPNGSMKNDMYSVLADLTREVSFEKVKQKINSKEKRSISRALLQRFFASITPIFSNYGIRNVDASLDLKYKKHIYNSTSCARWFIPEDGSKKNKTNFFGSFFYFGDPEYLLQIAVGEDNLHFGFAKYSVGINKKLTLRVMNNTEIGQLIEKFADISIEKPLKMNKGGIKWCSVDCGIFNDTSNEDITTAMLSFKDSDIFKNIIEPFSMSLSHDNSIPEEFDRSKIRYSPYSINFRITYKCNIHCRHCYNDANNKETLIIDRESALKVIKEAYDSGIKVMSITGGEPFLYPDLIIDMFETAIKLGYENVSVRTNGYWGKTLESAEEIYSRLDKIGFKKPVGSLGISAGEFHREFLDWKHVANIAIAQKKIFNYPLYIDFEQTPVSSHLAGEFKDYMLSQGLDETYYRLNVRTGLAIVGRMKENSEGRGLEQNLIPVQKLTCRPENMFTIEPNGDILPCCGFNRYIKGIAIGNIMNESVSDIIESVKDHKVMNMLFNKNFEEIQTELFGENNDLPTEYSSVCEACEKCFGQKVS